ncbi:hypothetical protein CC78DRAFT_574175 [Lojkania enalia]|uniref:Uncharacterized protein n=1 Tax=Lojkania enalia TaxID=147567 RepID=A0A9P4NBM6_9PLEO|nr:hypothetical protein CC78DRAFT_574175 [Didymosphaeria enalia]
MERPDPRSVAEWCWVFSSGCTTWASRSFASSVPVVLVRKNIHHSAGSARGSWSAARILLGLRRRQNVKTPNISRIRSGAHASHSPSPPSPFASRVGSPGHAIANCRAKLQIVHHGAPFQDINTPSGKNLCPADVDLGSIRGCEWLSIRAEPLPPLRRRTGLMAWQQLACIAVMVQKYHGPGIVRRYPGGHLRWQKSICRGVDVLRMRLAAVCPLRGSRLRASRVPLHLDRYAPVDAGGVRFGPGAAMVAMVVDDSRCCASEKTVVVMGDELSLCYGPGRPNVLQLRKGVRLQPVHHAAPSLAPLGGIPASVPVALDYVMPVYAARLHSFHPRPRRCGRRHGFVHRHRPLPR